MSKQSLTLRFSQSILDEINMLIDAGKYGSYSDFMNRAAADLLQWEKNKDMNMEMMMKILKTEEGKKLLRELLEDSGCD